MHTELPSGVWSSNSGVAPLQGLSDLGNQRFGGGSGTFATVRLRTRVTKGPGSRAQGIAMAFKLVEPAQARWRKVNAPHLVALVRAGATFRNGELNEHNHEHTGGGVCPGTRGDVIRRPAWKPT